MHKNTTTSRLVSGVSLALLSSMVMAAAPNTTTVRQVITGLSPFPCAPTSNTATSHPILNSEVEPDLDVALNPASPLSPPIVVAAWQQDRYTRAGGANDIYMRVSMDGGATFGSMIPMRNVFCFGGPFERSSDPRVTISSNGIIYFVGLGFDHATDPNAVSIARYDLATQSFIDLTELNAVKGIAQPTATDFSKLTVEPNDPSGNTLYLTWDRYFQGSYFTGNPHVLSDRGKLYFSKSLDGATWSQPKPIFNTYTDLASQYAPDVQVSGAHIVLVNNSKTDQFSRLVDLMGVQTGLVNPDVSPHNFTEVVTSDNQGTTWSKPSVVNPDGLVGTAVNPEHYDASQDFITNHSNSQVIRSGDAVDQADVDRTRNLIYSVIQEHSLIYDHTPCRIDLYVSKDGGTSWTLIGPVNRVLSTQAFNQGIAVLNDGRIAISYYDFRNHQAGSSTLETDRWLDIYSYDPASDTLTFQNEVRLTATSFDYLKAPALGGTAISPAGLFLGDYQTVKSFNGVIYSVFGITTDDPNNQSDILFTITTDP